MNTEKVTLEKAIALILDAKGEGTFMNVEFMKRTTGELRSMTCRGGVSKYVTGKGMAFDPAAKGLIGVWEVGNKEGNTGKDAYRMISVEGVQSVTTGGIKYEVIPA